MITCRCCSSCGWHLRLSLWCWLCCLSLWGDRTTWWCCRGRLRWRFTLVGLTTDSYNIWVENNRLIVSNNNDKTNTLMKCVYSNVTCTHIYIYISWLLCVKQNDLQCTTASYSISLFAVPSAAWSSNQCFCWRVSSCGFWVFSQTTFLICETYVQKCRGSGPLQEHMKTSSLTRMSGWNWSFFSTSTSVSNILDRITEQCCCSSFSQL